MVDLTLDQASVPFVIAILWSVVGFAFYYFLSRFSAAVIKTGQLSQESEFQVKKEFQIRITVIQRLWGFVFLGILSALLIPLVFDGSFKEYGLSFSFSQLPPWWSYLLIPLVVVTGFFSSRSPANLALYPQIRIRNWTPPILVFSALSWIAFLVAYEFMFRGLLLHASLSVMEPWSAIAINCTLYAFAHFYKGPLETFGAIPVGIILCYMTLLTGNIWSAVILHSVMALTNEWFSIRAHPEMELDPGWKSFKSRRLQQGLQPKQSQPGEVSEANKTKSI